MTTLSLEQIRQSQCQYRANTQCKFLNRQLGFPISLGLPECDKCWAAGPTSLEGARLRYEWAANIEHIISLHPRAQYTAAKSRIELQPPTFASKAKAYLSTLASNGFGLIRAASTTIRDRHISCHGTLPDGTKVGQSCVSRVNINGKYFCGACGCKHTAATELTVGGKLRHPYLQCPRKRKGFSNFGGPLRHMLIAISGGRFGR